MAKKKKYYDPEYNRIVDESVPKQQYQWFCDNDPYFNKSYEQFLEENFMPPKKYLIE